MNPFETETMAELCLRQGHRDEALGIYRRLLARTNDETASERMRQRLAALEGESVSVAPSVAGSEAAQPISSARAWTSDVEAPLSSPGVRARATGDELTLEWRLPPATKSPTIEVLLVKHGPDGIDTETRTLTVNDAAGRLMLTVKGLQLAKAAVGTRGDGRFVPLARG